MGLTFDLLNTANTMVGTRVRYFFDEEKIPSLKDTMKIGAFADYKKKYEPAVIVPNVPLSRIFTERIIADKQSDKRDSSQHSSKALGDSKNTTDSKVSENKVSVESRKEDKENKDSDNSEKNGNESSTTEVESRLSAITMVSTNDDFIMVDLKTPFANVNERSELGLFYQEWQKAPPLQEFTDLAPLEELELTKQLETFESEVNEYDSIVQSLCQSPNNN